MKLLTSTTALSLLTLSNLDQTESKKNKRKVQIKGGRNAGPSSASSTPTDLGGNLSSWNICTPKSKSQYCQAKYAAIRADNEGIDFVANMVRTNICRHFFPTRRIGKCPVLNKHVRSMLRNYACNCFPENYDAEPQTTNSKAKPSWHMGANGKPVDEIDAACRRLRDRYTCITFDVENEVLAHPDPSSPDNQDYCGRLTTYEYHIDADKEIICGPETNPEYAANNPEDECRKAVCNIERQFADEVFTHIGDNAQQYEIDNADMYSLFNDNSQCVSGNNGHAVSECCGSYPLRVPFIPFIKTCCDMGNGIFEPQFVGDC